MTPQWNVQVGDVVLLRKSELHRNSWSLAFVIRADPEKDGLVRKVELRTSKDGQPQVFVRPVAEVILLAER